MKTSQTVFKLCACSVVETGSLGQLTSCCQSFCFPEEYRTTYIVGMNIMPRIAGTKLFCFETFTDLVRFASSCAMTHRPKYGVYFRAFEGIGYNPRPTSIRASLNEITDFWMAPDNWCRHIYSVGTPAGTLWVDSITLMHEMHIPA